MRDRRGPAVLPADDPAALTEAVLALRAGGIVGVPTETVYGLAVEPRPESLQALIAAKQRPEEKGVALLIDGLDQVEALVETPDLARRLAAGLWPGPLTLVLPLSNPDRVPPLLTGGRTTLGLRVPDHAVPRALSRQVGPIATSSANRSGEPDAITAAALIEAVGASLALVLDGGPVRGGVPSTVIAVDTDNTLQVLREGALTSDAIAACLAEGQ